MKTIKTSFPQSNLEKFYNKVDEVQKRAKRLKVSPIVVEVGHPYMGKWGAKVEGIYGTEIKEIDCTVIDVTLSWGDDLKLPSEHKLLAVLENVEGHSFVTSLVENNDFSEYRTHNFKRCDHCGHKRYRKKAMVIDYEGKEMVIGSSCIVDYLGYDPVNALHSATLLKDFRLLCEYDEEIYGVRDRFFGDNIRNLVENTVMALSMTNWSYIKYDQMSTMSRVYSMYQAHGYVEFNKDYTPLVDKIMERYDALTDKLKKDEDLSNFEYKLAVLNKIGFAEDKNMNVIIGSVGGMIKGLIKAQENAKRGESEYIGSIGDKVELDIEVTRVHVYEDHNFSYYGDTKFIISGFANGKDKFTWFTGYNAGFNSGLVVNEYVEEIGENVESPAKGIIKIKATVKQHKDDKYGISTVLTRVKKVS
jgi:hypothetical protein